MTTIAYDQPVEDFIDGLNATDHVTHQSFKKTSVTLHHNGGERVSHQEILDTWKTRPASAHFDVDVDGKIAQYVKVDEYAWAVGDLHGNESSVSIEMADAVGSPTWQVSDATLASAERLAAWLFVHVIGTRPAANNVFPHQHWVQTDCPGPYVMREWTTILAGIQHQYDLMVGNKKPVPSTKTVVQLAHEVIQGLWGNGGERVTRLRAAGYIPELVQAEVNLELTGHAGTVSKTVSQLAHEVINGEWGNDPQRSQKLTAAGYNAHQVQLEVDRMLA